MAINCLCILVLVNMIHSISIFSAYQVPGSGAKTGAYAVPPLLRNHHPNKGSVENNVYAVSL